MLALRRIGYYRLSAFTYPFRAPRAVAASKISKRSDKFVVNATFEDALHLYSFDDKLRMVLLEGLHAIEVALAVRTRTRAWPSLPASTERFDIEVVHPDDFLMDQLDLFPVARLGCAWPVVEVVVRNDYRRAVSEQFLQFFITCKKYGCFFTCCADMPALFTHDVDARRSLQLTARTPAKADVESRTILKATIEARAALAALD